MDLYVINLAAQTRRREWMAEQLSAFDVNFQFFDAVDREAVDSRFAAFRDDGRRQSLRPAELGCMLSHIGCWKLIADGNSKFAAVLEDDIHFASDFGEMLKAFDGDPDELAVHKLETFFATVNVQRKAKHRWGRYSAHRLFTNHGGTGAYVVSQATARELVRQSEAFKSPIDTELFDFGRRAWEGATVYQWLPAPCIQDHVLEQDWSMDRPSSEQGFGSGIVEGGRTPNHVGFEAFKRRVKRALRAPYMLLYSAILAPRGQRRVRVPFG